ncbi:MAG: polysaccharide deacetylase family protein [Deltaproteobacteria bacterium]|nr:polysaccharide deacetylase family protein [Deltaproteobacteria bacterium]
MATSTHSADHHVPLIMRACIGRVRWRERLLGAAAGLLSFQDNNPLLEAWQSGNLILLYHRIVDDSEISLNPFTVPRSLFESQVAWLSRIYTMMTASELVRLLASSPSVSRCAVITFDDGHESIFTHAWPILQAYGVPATLFLDTGRLDVPPALSCAQIMAMVAHGIEIGSHSISHVDLRLLSDAALRYEMATSREFLSGMIGHRITGLAYPFGYYDDRVVRFVRQAGYTYACTCLQHRTNHLGDDPYQLSRLEINLHDNRERFQRKLDGHYAAVYATLYRLQAAMRPCRVK